MFRALLPGLLVATGAAAAGEPSPQPPEPLPGEVVLVAGSGDEGYSGDGGPAVEARLNHHLRLATAPGGTLYIADRTNGRLRFVDGDGVIDTVPGTRSVGGADPDAANPPIAAAVGPDGGIYVAGETDVRRIAPDGTVTVLAGAGDDDIEHGDADGGAALDARIRLPEDIVVDAAGDVILADSGNGRIRRIGADGVITTIAGGGEEQVEDAVDGPATQAALYTPVSVAADSTGTVYFTLLMSPDLYEVGPDGVLGVIEGEKLSMLDQREELAGTADPGGRRLAVGPDDELYVTDAANGRLRVLRDGMIEVAGALPATAGDITVAADGTVHYVDGTQVWRLPQGIDEPADAVAPAGSSWPDRGPGDVVTVAGAVTSREDALPPLLLPDPYLGPLSVAAGPDGVSYVADPSQHVVHRVGAGGAVSVAAGTGEQGSGGDDGPADEALLDHPVGVAVDADGTLYIADSSARTVRRVGRDGVISTVAGSGADPGDEPPPVCVGEPAAEAVLGAPSDVAIGPDGALYLADSALAVICRVGPDGVLTRVAGGGELWAKDADGRPALEAGLWGPGAIDVDDDGNVYVVEDGRPHVRMIRPDGTLVAFAGDSLFGLDEGGFAGDGGPAVAAELNTPGDVVAGPDGVYIADAFNNRIRRVGPDGVIETVAGTGAREDSGDGGPATEAGLSEPVTVDVAPDGALVVAGTREDDVRRIGPDGVIETVADLTVDDGTSPEPADAATLTTPMAIAVGPDGTLLVAEPQRQRLRRLDGADLVGVGPADRRLGDVGRIATGPGGEIYATLGDSVARVYPDGRRVTVAGGGRTEQAAVADAQAVGQPLRPGDVAVGPDGRVHLFDLATQRVYWVDHEGALRAMSEFDDVTFELPSGLAVGPDGTVYVNDEGGNVVYAARSGEPAEVFAGTGESTITNGDAGDGGPAEDAILQSPVDVETDADGNVYVADFVGIRRVDAEGTISTILDAAPDEETDRWITTLAAGPGGDLYAVDSETRQVIALVRAGEISGGFPWWTAGAGAGALLAAGGAVVLIRRRRASTTHPDDTTEGNATP
ncbi:hypothetical protein [Jiangella sp. DSM 45060]|uniref:NHL domain-containing protein n=1 Tax=Jiangella sp. DSM 45060 TaxID=1798224 RepID=UPI000B87F34B|nr:hypothetical protein [Jiangella sp. DSM 45060]